jgi:sugar/nucleoside kinase (ribokinase family)
VTARTSVLASKPSAASIDVVDSNRVTGRSTCSATDGSAPCGLRLVQVVDTTGAGDSYIAGFLRARLTGADVPQAMHAAAASAARTCTHLGAWPQQPVPLR